MNRIKWTDSEYDMVFKQASNEIKLHTLCKIKFKIFRNYLEEYLIEVSYSGFSEPNFARLNGRFKTIADAQQFCEDYLQKLLIEMVCNIKRLNDE